MNWPATTTNPASRRAVLVAGLAGISASILVGAAEFSLHFTPSLSYGGPEYEFFLGTSPARLTMGHFAGIFSAPLYFAGYWHLFQRLKPASEKLRLLLLGLGIYSFAIGAVWLGSRVYPAIIIQARDATANDAAREQIAILLSRASYFDDSVLSALRMGVLACSGILVWLVASGATHYPRWFAALNPVLLVMVCFLIYRLLPSIGGYLMPIAMNVAHFILFGVSTWLLIREERSPC